MTDVVSVSSDWGDRDTTPSRHTAHYQRYSTTAWHIGSVQEPYMYVWKVYLCHILGYIESQVYCCAQIHSIVRFVGVRNTHGLIWCQRNAKKIGWYIFVLYIYALLRSSSKLTKNVAPNVWMINQTLDDSFLYCQQRFVEKNKWYLWIILAIIKLFCSMENNGIVGEIGLKYSPPSHCSHLTGRWETKLRPEF